MYCTSFVRGIITVVQTQNNRSVRSWIGIYKYWIATQPIHNWKGFDPNISSPAHTKNTPIRNNYSGEKLCLTTMRAQQHINDRLTRLFPVPNIYIIIPRTHPQPFFSVLIFGAVFLIKCFTNMETPFFGTNS